MATAVKVVDETTRGDRTGELTLEFLDERVTVREVIRSRVYQEVTEYNARIAAGAAGGGTDFRGLVQPTDAERTLNGYRLRTPRRISWEQQLERALKAFEANGFLLLVDDRQVTDLDEEVHLKHDSTVTFLKLVQLVGG
jgi:20S proteasome alpha/beta subunit